MKEVEPRGEGLGLTITYWASAVLYNGLGRYEEALPVAQQASEHPEDLGFSNWGLIELIVAAVRSGDIDLAADALQRLAEMTHASGTDWALGIEARSRALLSEGERVERLYPRGDRAAGSNPHSRGAGPRASAVRGVAA